MVATIGSMVHGRQPLRRTAAALHVLGGVLGGALTGLLAGALGAGIFHLFPDASAYAGPTLATVAGTSILHSMLSEGRSFGLRRQTPRGWRGVLNPGPLAFAYGFDLGLGWSTRIYSASFVPVLAAAVLSGDPFTGTVVMAAFGASRSLLVVAAARRWSTVEAIRRLDSSRRAVTVTTVLMMVGLVLTLLAEPSSPYQPL